jgi:hypothetical protein
MSTDPLKTHPSLRRAALVKAEYSRQSKQAGHTRAATAHGMHERHA